MSHSDWGQMLSFLLGHVVSFFCPPAVLGPGKPWAKCFISLASVWSSVKWADGWPSCLRPSILCGSGLLSRGCAQGPSTRCVLREETSCLGCSQSQLQLNKSWPGGGQHSWCRAPERAGVLPVSWALPISPTTLFQTTSSSSPWSQPSTRLQEASSRWFHSERLCVSCFCVLTQGPFHSVRKTPKIYKKDKNKKKKVNKKEERKKNVSRVPVWAAGCRRDF